MTGGRLKKIDKILKDQNFMVTYGDGLANINLKKLLNFHLKHKKIASVTAVRPLSRYGILDIKGNSVLTFKEKLSMHLFFNNRINFLILSVVIFSKLSVNGNDASVL